MRKKDNEKEQRIKKAVIKLMLQEGFDGTSISKIAKIAEVSPATVYVYFENKEDMLKDIYQEYSKEVFDYLVSCLKPEMDSADIIETLIRGYYTYMLENPEAFSFVEQFSNCPAMASKCSEKKGMCHIFGLISEMKKEHMVKSYSNECLAAIIFYPVKAIALDSHMESEQQEKLLEELIQIIQNAILL